MHITQVLKNVSVDMHVAADKFKYVLCLFITCLSACLYKCMQLWCYF